MTRLTLLVRCAALVALLAAQPQAAAAQGPTVAAAQAALSGCRYDACAIRIDRSLFGGRRVMVGLDGRSTPMGALGGGLVRAVDVVPAARDEAQLGRRNAVKALVAGVIGTVLVSFAAQGTRGDPIEWNDAQVISGLLAGGAAVITAGVQTTYADRHFSRAVWLYNRELPR